MQIAYPLTIAQSEVVTAGPDAHIRQMIEQVLFTSQGERVNRPDFGCGLYAAVFEPMSNEMLVVTQALVHANLLQWLGDLIHIEQVTVEAQDTRLVVRIGYAVLANGQRGTETFIR
jgi:phage baseplate assembly protein W